MPDALIGREIFGGEYRVVEKIASGGMGAVYRVWDTAMGRDVALKVLHARVANRPDIASRFRREARALSHLFHPNTVRVLQSGEIEPGRFAIVMELLAGKTLHHLIRRERRLPPARALRILSQAARALDEAHRCGIVHRDVKPENIFVCSAGPVPDFVKVVDFGLARVTEREVGEESNTHTIDGTVFGTPEFISPEQALGLRVGPPSDVYSLGVVLFESLTGRSPYRAHSPREYLEAHVRTAPIELSASVPGLEFPDYLSNLVSSALEKAPDRRFENGGAFADAVEDALARWNDDAGRRVVAVTAASTSPFAAVTQTEAGLVLSSDALPASAPTVVPDTVPEPSPPRPTQMTLLAFLLGALLGGVSAAVASR